MMRCTRAEFKRIPTGLRLLVGNTLPVVTAEELDDEAVLMAAMLDLLTVHHEHHEMSRKLRGSALALMDENEVWSSVHPLVDGALAMHQTGTPQAARTRRINECIGNPETSEAPADAVQMAREVIARHCKRGHSAAQRPPGDLDCRADVDANLLTAWQRAAMDPDHAVCERLLNGAPACLRINPEA